MRELLSINSLYPTVMYYIKIIIILIIIIIIIIIIIMLPELFELEVPTGFFRQRSERDFLKRLKTKQKNH